MALIYRTVIEVDGTEPVADALKLFGGWVHQKYGEVGPELIPGDEPRVLDVDGRDVSQVEVQAESGEADESAAVRCTLYEKRVDDAVKTTLLAMHDEAGSFVVADIERWADDAFERAWVPFAPRLVGLVLESYDCRCGSDSLRASFESVERTQGQALVEDVTHPERRVPLIVVSPSLDEREGDMAPAIDRANQICRHLRGIGRTVLLQPGATQEFSRGITDSLGAGWDVHSGAIRIYMPGTGRHNDSPYRHRLFPPHRLGLRSRDRVGRAVAGPVIRGACHQPLPALWRERIRRIEPFAGGGNETELIEMLESENRELSARADELELIVEAEREDSETYLRRNEDLERQIVFLSQRLREVGGDPYVDESELEVFAPDFCIEVVERAREELDAVVVPAHVDEGAEQLDDHATPSWAKKAWKALVALQAYAEWSRGGGEGNFRVFCERGEAAAIPNGWVALAESETTDQNARFRALRTFSVDPGVAPAGELYMPAHIKLEPGGYPAPRIHFHDDTGGSTGRLHVGWLGPHRDNKSKN